GPAGVAGPAGARDRQAVSGRTPERSAAGRPAAPRPSRRCRRFRPAGQAAWTGTPPTPESLTGTLSLSTSQERRTGGKPPRLADPRATGRGRGAGSRVRADRL